MSNNKYNVNDIDAIFKVLDENDKIREVIEGTERAIRLEDKRIEQMNPHLGWYTLDGKPFTKEQYRELMRTQTAERTREKSVGKPEIYINKAELVDKTMEFFKKYKIAIAGTLAAVTIATIKLGPPLKANSQISDLSNKMSEELIEMNYCKQRDNIFSQLHLSIAPDKLINNLNLTSNSHMRLYILSTVLHTTDFENILKELGYNSLLDYVKKLGFEYGYRTAIENYQIEYDAKLQELIQNLNKNPENIDEYLEIYPELGFIYEPNNTILTANAIYTTKGNGRR